MDLYIIFFPSRDRRVDRVYNILRRNEGTLMFGIVFLYAKLIFLNPVFCNVSYVESWFLVLLKKNMSRLLSSQTLQKGGWGTKSRMISSDDFNARLSARNKCALRHHQ